MEFEILYLNKIKNTRPFIGNLLYKWFGIETDAYKSWWKLYSNILNTILLNQLKYHNS